jgi:hypothetical protein
VRVTGTYAVEENRIIFHDEDCASDGSYEWSYRAHTLTLERMQDTCIARAFLFTRHPFTRGESEGETE